MSPANLQAVYYRTTDGAEPVLDFLVALDVKRRAALLRQLDRLNDLSDAIPHLPFPHSSQVDGELRELRCHMGSEHYRVLGPPDHPSARLPEDDGKAAAGRYQDRPGTLGGFQGADGRQPPQAAASGGARCSLEIAGDFTGIVSSAANIVDTSNRYRSER